MTVYIREGGPPPVALPGTPTLTWTNPAPIAYGTALTGDQLNATANVSGSFAYSPGNGTVLNEGVHALSVVFTPSDMVDYTSVTDAVNLVVTGPLPPVIQEITVSGASILFTWSEIINQAYQIQSTTVLSPAYWTNLGTTIHATNSTMTASEALGSNFQEFYHVVLLR